MNEIAPMKSEHLFMLAGLASALITLTLGGFWIVVFELGTGFIFAVALFTAESLLQRRSRVSARTSLWKRLSAGAIVAISYVIGVMIVATVGVLFDRLGVRSRTLTLVCGMSVAGTSTSFAFYGALRITTKAQRVALLQLLLIALATAVISGSADVWGQGSLVLGPHWFTSPAWATLLVIGETGFAWVWGKSRLTPSPPHHLSVRARLADGAGRELHP